LLSPQLQLAFGTKYGGAWLTKATTDRPETRYVLSKRQMADGSWMEEVC
jgi:hypothetical protein